MPPNATSVATGVLNEEDAETIDGGLMVDVVQLKKAEPRKLRIVWRNVILFGYLHAAALYGLWLAITSAMWPTIAFGKFLKKNFLLLALFERHDKDTPRSDIS